MHSQWAALATFAAMVLATVAKPLAPPTTGWLYSNLINSSYILPFTATQCEPFYIFYNSTVAERFRFYDATRSRTFLIITVPKGIGYVKWNCNVPAGLGFNVELAFDYNVQAGSSSACLGHLNTASSILSYATTSYTQDLPTNTFPTTTFPTGAYSTITHNPHLAFMPKTSPPSSSSPVTPSTSSPPSSTMSSPFLGSPLSSPSSSSPLSSPITLSSPKPHSALVAGGIVGAVAFFLLILAIMLWRKRKSSELARASSPIDSQPSFIWGLSTGQLGSTGLSSPFRFSAGRLSGAESLGGTQQYPSSPPDPWIEFKSDNPIGVPVTGNPAAHVNPIVGQRSSQGAIIRPLLNFAYAL